jgi:hypothetical protein
MSDSKVSFADVWNAVKDVATLAKNNEHTAMPARAFVAPAGHQPIDLNWDKECEQPLELPPYRYDTYASAHSDGHFSPTVIRVGVRWKFGGSFQGYGLFLHDAEMYVVVDSTCVGACVDATGSFSATPVMVNGVAHLEGTIDVQVKELGGAMHVQDLHFNLLVCGDGAGHLRQA